MISGLNVMDGDSIATVALRHEKFARWQRLPVLQTVFYHHPRTLRVCEEKGRGKRRKGGGGNKFQSLRLLSGLGGTSNNLSGYKVTSEY
jgi:hypothetical protein